MRFAARNKLRAKWEANDRQRRKLEMQLDRLTTWLAQLVDLDPMVDVFSGAKKVWQMTFVPAGRTPSLGGTWAASRSSTAPTPFSLWGERDEDH